jgi:hypothetical protein
MLAEPPGPVESVAVFPANWDAAEQVEAIETHVDTPEAREVLTREMNGRNSRT